MKKFFDNSLLIDFEVDTLIHSITGLKEFGIEQGYVTDDDIRRFFL